MAFEKALVEFFMAKEISAPFFSRGLKTKHDMFGRLTLGTVLENPEFTGTGWFLMEVPRKGYLLDMFDQHFGVRKLTTEQERQRTGELEAKLRRGLDESWTVHLTKHPIEAVEVQLPDLAQFVPGAARSWLPD